MRSNIFSTIILVSLLSASATSFADQNQNLTVHSTELRSLPSEEGYLKARDGFMHQFKKVAPTEDKDSQALAALDKQMKSIIGPITIKGFPNEGHISLETLKDDPCCDYVDGLVFNNIGDEKLFVTTPILLKDYLARHRGLPKELGRLSRTGEIYSSTVSFDAAVTNYAEIPVRNAKGQVFAYAFLGLSAQDIGPFIPENIFVFVSTGDRIFLFSSSTTLKVSEIPVCKNQWDSYSKKSAKALEIYRASHLKNNRSFEEHVRLEEGGFTAYYRCYREKSKDQSFFTPLAKQAQAIVDRLQIAE